MPGETKIFKNANGWYDVDNPGVYHRTREECRDARKATRKQRVAAALAAAGPQNQPHPSDSAPKPPTASTPTINGAPLTSLQQRLFDRMTTRQYVSPEDAMLVIALGGYNKAASYGHMREAGANHSEAFMVINLNEPDVSLAYGLARGAGFDHAAALRRALDGDV